MIGGNGFIESIQYDTVHGQVTLHVDLEGRVTRYVYDNTPEGQGRLIREEFWSTETAFTADPGTPEQTITYTYDDLGRQETVVDSLNGTWSYTYDAINGAVTQVASPQGAVNHAYDETTGRLTRTWTDSIDTRYTYDAFERLLHVVVVERNDTVPTQNTRTVEWFGTNITGEVTEYAYDDVGNLDRILQSNGVVADYQYDALNRLNLLVHYKDDDASGQPSHGTWDDNGNGLVDDPEVLAAYEYQLALDGARERVIETDDTGEKTEIVWTYDALGRLVSEAYDRGDNGASAGDYVTIYELDLVGNRLHKLTDRYDGDNNIDGADDEAVSYTYDANDRLLAETQDDLINDGNDHHTVYIYSFTEQTNKAVHQGLDDQGAVVEEHAFTYNRQGRLKVAVVTKDGTTTRTRYTYDSAGIRVASEELDGSGNVISRTTFLIDANNHTGYQQVLEEWVDQDGDGSGAAALNRTYTLGHDVIAQTAPAVDVTPPNGIAAGDPLVLLYDGHGSTRALLDAAAQVIQRFAYDAYGTVLDGPGLTAASAALTTLLYSGEQFDHRSQMQYLRARYYDPATGRFRRLDPFMGNINDPQSLHKYLYTHANPVMFADPSGLCTPQQFGTWATYEVGAIYQFAHFTDNVRINRGIPGSLTTLRPDIANYTLSQVAEVKPATPYGLRTGLRDLSKYLVELPIATGRVWTPSRWQPGFVPIVVPYCPNHFGITVGNAGGVIYYVRFRLPGGNDLKQYANELARRLRDMLHGQQQYLAVANASVVESSIGAVNAFVADLSSRAEAVGGVVLSRQTAQNLSNAFMTSLLGVLAIVVIKGVYARAAA